MAKDLAGKLESSGFQGSRYKAERIVRTELHNALNAGRQAAIVAAAEEFPDMQKQWSARSTRERARRAKSWTAPWWA